MNKHPELFDLKALAMRTRRQTDKLFDEYGQPMYNDITRPLEIEERVALRELLLNVQNSARLAEEAVAKALQAEFRPWWYKLLFHNK